MPSHSWDRDSTWIFFQGNCEVNECIQTAAPGLLIMADGSKLEALPRLPYPSACLGLSAGPTSRLGKCSYPLAIALAMANGLANILGSILIRKLAGWKQVEVDNLLLCPQHRTLDTSQRATEHIPCSSEGTLSRQSQGTCINQLWLEMHCSPVVRGT